MYSVWLVSMYSYLVFFSAGSLEVEDASERRLDKKPGRLLPFEEEGLVLFLVLRVLKRNVILLAALGDLLLFYEEVMNDSPLLLLEKSVVVGRANLCSLEHPFRRWRYCFWRS